MMIDKDANDLLELLRTHLEIPENVDYLRLELKVDQPVRVDCGYYPEKKE